MPEPTAPVPVDVVAAPSAPAGRPDPTRRWALRMPDGAERFPGVTRPEGHAAAPVLGGLTPARRRRALVAVTLPVVLSDGAGPHLLDADGRLTLALGPHPAVADARVAMGEPGPAHRVGLVRPVAGPVWEWLAMREVAPAGRVAALEALDALADERAAAAWAGAADR